ncbi:MAG: M48 family metallopeptidase [Elusimicrobiota bacterium]
MPILSIPNKICIKQSESKISDKQIQTNEFKSVIFKWADKIKVEPKEIHLRLMKNKWASLSESGRLTFNTELFGMDRSFCDYVIVHELLHIKVPNHGKLFKSLMFAFLPNWEKYSKKLKIDE